MLLTYSMLNSRFCQRMAYGLYSAYANLLPFIYKPSAGELRSSGLLRSE